MIQTVTPWRIARTFVAWVRVTDEYRRLVMLPEWAAVALLFVGFAACPDVFVRHILFTEDFDAVDGGRHR